MIKLITTLMKLCDDSMSPFYEVYLFGSALNCDCPNDVDLLLVYEGESTFEISKTKTQLTERVYSKFGLTCHFVTLSNIELDQTRFLCYVDYVRIQ